MLIVKSGLAVISVWAKNFPNIFQGRVAFRRESVTIEDLESNVSADLLAEEGTNAVSSLGSSVTWNSTDSSFNPTKGLVVTGSTDLAGGPLGVTRIFTDLKAAEVIISRLNSSLFWNFVCAAVSSLLTEIRRKSRSSSVSLPAAPGPSGVTMSAGWDRWTPIRKIRSAGRAWWSATSSIRSPDRLCQAGGIF